METLGQIADNRAQTLAITIRSQPYNYEEDTAILLDKYQAIEPKP